MSRSINTLASLGMALVLMVSSMRAEEADRVKLTIGSPAPELKIEHWVSLGGGKGPVTKFEAGKVYVIEFWATWCGPCIGSMPHLAEVQKKYVERGVQIISISDEDLEAVQEFLKGEVEQTEGSGAAPQTYAQLTSVYSLTTDPDKSSFEEYMDNAGQHGIPTAFIVGKSGLIEWIGYPGSMDAPLEAVVDGSWDRVAYLKTKEHVMSLLRSNAYRLAQQPEELQQFLATEREKFRDDPEALLVLEGLELGINWRRVALPIIAKSRAGDVPGAMAALEEELPQATGRLRDMLQGLRFQLILQSGDHEQAATVLSEVTNSESATGHLIYQLTGVVLGESQKPDANVPKDLLAAAVRAAERAVELEPDDAGIISTLAHLLSAQGDWKRSLELQELALEKAPPTVKEILQKELEALKSKAPKE